MNVKPEATRPGILDEHYAERVRVLEAMVDERTKTPLVVTMDRDNYDPSPQQIVEDQRRDIARAAREIGTDPAKLSEYLCLPLGLVEQRLCELGIK